MRSTPASHTWEYTSEITKTCRVRQRSDPPSRSGPLPRRHRDTQSTNGSCNRVTVVCKWVPRQVRALHYRVRLTLPRRLHLNPLWTPSAKPMAGSLVFACRCDPHAFSSVIDLTHTHTAAGRAILGQRKGIDFPIILLLPLLPAHVQ